MRDRVQPLLVVLTALCVAAAAPPATADELLLRDDFDGAALDTAKWLVPTGEGTFFGRTQIRPPTMPLEVSGGVIRLQLDTWNPSGQVPGDSFLGSEIDSVETWPVASGLSFQARTRLVPGVPGGVVGSVFSYVFLPAIPGHDEIDFELLGNDVVASRERVLTNVFDDADFSQPGDPLFVGRPGLDPSAFHLYEVRWLPGRVEWWVDGERVRVETETVPDAPQNVRLNFWAPDAFFADAYDAALQPATSPGENQTWYYEVDFVEVRRLAAPLPGVGAPALWGLLALAGASLWAVRRRLRR
jgi:hypothetical protein